MRGEFGPIGRFLLLPFHGLNLLASRSNASHGRPLCKVLGSIYIRVNSDIRDTLGQGLVSLMSDRPLYQKLYFRVVV